MKTICKYTLEVTDLQSVRMPITAEILTVQIQQGKPHIWAIVDPEQDTDERVFEIIGTGHPMLQLANTDRNYIGTFQMMAGELVFHVFERLLPFGKSLPL